MPPIREKVVWVVEPNVFPEGHSQIGSAAKIAGHHVILWNDDWWSDNGWPEFEDAAVVFHGSLGNASRIRAEIGWQPGAFCDVERFHCSSWYPHAKEWLLHRDWRILPADQFVANARQILRELGSVDKVFVRPDNPLKPFSGRIVPHHQISLAALDYGYYYDDPSTPVVVSPVRSIGKEWRHVIVSGQVVASSAYDPVNRAASREVVSGESIALATEIAQTLSAPEEVYVIDICECENELCLLELNPFSGADLYFCDPVRVVEAVSTAVLTMFNR